MVPLPEELQALLAREKVRDCIARLARGEDRRDPDAIRKLFWPDASTDYGIFRGAFEEYLAWITPGSPAVTNTQHFLGQSVIDLDGPRARVETHVIAYHRVDMGEAERDICMAGRYLDTVDRRDGEWRISQRTMLYDWVQDLGVSVDWSLGIMGSPFSAPHFSGRTLGDYSETFFGARRPGS